jgi:hypothetical protein
VGRKDSKVLTAKVAECPSGDAREPSATSTTRNEFGSPDTMRWLRKPQTIYRIAEAARGLKIFSAFGVSWTMRCRIAVNQAERPETWVRGRYGNVRGSSKRPLNLAATALVAVRVGVSPWSMVA